jgi:type I restriction enzyme S subunit
VGVIPEDWEVRSFGELFEFRNGVNADKASYGQGVRFINVLEPITYSHIYGPEITGQVSLPEPIIISYAVRRGDVLLNRTSETQEELGLAATYLGIERVVFGGFVIRGRPTDRSLDPIYSGYALRASIIRSQIIPMGQGAVRANIGQQSLRLVVAPVPPAPEQQAIAEALSDVDALIESLEKLIAKKRQIKQGAMQELLTGKRRLPGFESKPGYKQTEVGVIPEDWEIQNGEEITMLIGKGSSPRWQGFDYAIDGMLFITSENVRHGFLDIQEPKYLPIAFHDKLKRTKLLLNDILINLVGASIGRSCRICFEVGEANVNQAVAVFRVKDEYSASFFAYYFQLPSTIDRILDMQVDAARQNISLGDLRSFLIPLPAKAEQTAIAAILSDMDAEITSLETKLTKARQIKQGMMQELLTGRIRLI